MFCAEEEFWCTIPYGDDDLVTCKEGLQGLIDETSQTEIANLDDARGGDKDVRGFEVAVEDMGGMEVEEAVEKLVSEGFEKSGGDGGAEGLGVMVDELLGRDEW